VDEKAVAVDAAAVFVAVALHHHRQVEVPAVGAPKLATRLPLGAPPTPALATTGTTTTTVMTVTPRQTIIPR